MVAEKHSAIEDDADVKVVVEDDLVPLLLNDFEVGKHLGQLDRPHAFLYQPGEERHVAEEEHGLLCVQPALRVEVNNPVELGEQLLIEKGVFISDRDLL